jgi:hypothetical protein
MEDHHSHRGWWDDQRKHGLYRALIKVNDGAHVSNYSPPSQIGFKLCDTSLPSAVGPLGLP